MPNKNDSTISVAELGCLPLFAGEEAACLEWLAQRAHVLALAKDATLLSPQRVNTRFYIILRGRVRVEPPGAAVRYLGRGECVGEMSVIDRRLPSAAVFADTRAKLLVIDRETFWAMLEQSRVLARNLLRILSSRVRKDQCVIAESFRDRRRYERESQEDALTGLFNRRWLDEALSGYYAEWVRRGHPLSIAMVDVDHFKRYNDRFGHAVGDIVLRAVAAALRTHVDQTDEVVRYGGEEFVVIMPGKQADQARAVAERLVQSMRVQALADADRNALPGITVSVGWASSALPMEPGALLQAADAFLYEAKGSGRDCSRGGWVEDEPVCSAAD